MQMDDYLQNNEYPSCDGAARWMHERYHTYTACTFQFRGSLDVFRGWWTGLLSSIEHGSHGLTYHRRSWLILSQFTLSTVRLPPTFCMRN